MLIVGPLISLFWTSGDNCGGFQSQGGSLACFLGCALYLRFTSGVTPADCIEVSMAAESFQSTYLCGQALLEVRRSIRRLSVRQTQGCKPFGHSGLAQFSSCSRFNLAKLIFIHAS